MNESETTINIFGRAGENRTNLPLVCNVVFTGKWTARNGQQFGNYKEREGRIELYVNNGSVIDKRLVNLTAFLGIVDGNYRDDLLNKIEFPYVNLTDKEVLIPPGEYEIEEYEGMGMNRKRFCDLNITITYRSEVNSSDTFIHLEVFSEKCNLDFFADASRDKTVIFQSFLLPLS